MTTNTTPKPLHITGIPAGDQLLRRDGTALLIGMLLDQQVPMEWAFTGPYTIKQRLGHCDAKKIAAMNVEDFVAMCRPPIRGNRFPTQQKHGIADSLGGPLWGVQATLGFSRNRRC